MECNKEIVWLHLRKLLPPNQTTHYPGTSMCVESREVRGAAASGGGKQAGKVTGDHGSAMCSLF